MLKENKKMLVNVDDDETRIAAVTGNTLDNLHIEQTGPNRQIGNIYRGKVVKVQSSFQAAFVDYGAERDGFLSFSDVNFQVFKANGHSQSKSVIEKFLKPGQWIMVQVTRNKLGNKGASLTTHISLPGRFLVFMPNSNKGGVSKKIEDMDTRTRLKNLLEGICGEKDSAIIRTAGVNRSASELKRDFMVLRRKWNEILRKYESAVGTNLLYEEEDVVVRTLRDYFIDEIAEIWIDQPETFQRAREFFKANMPNQQKRLQFYLGDRSIFSDYGVEYQIEQLSSNHVPLPSGGSLVIDPTEALVAIDVNSGRYSQSNGIEETALQTNLEAAEEIARQLRLRNLGGLIVIDFVDMALEDNRNAVVKKLEEWMQDDKAKWTLGSISQFGLLEMSRQRIANALSQEMKTTCPTCGGIGEVLSIPSLANAVLRKIRDLAATSTRGSGEIVEIHSHVPVELTNHLFNKKRQQLDELEVEFDINVVLIADLSIDPGILPDFEVINKTVGTSEKVRGRAKKSMLKEQDDSDKEKDEKAKSIKNRQKKAKSVVIPQPTEFKNETESAVDLSDDSLHSKEDKLAQVEKPSKPVPLYSSAHQSPPAEQAGGVPLVLPSKKVSSLHENSKDVPAGTVLFSSSHRESLENLTPGKEEEISQEELERANQQTEAKELKKSEADEARVTEKIAKDQSTAKNTKKKPASRKKTTIPSKKTSTNRRESAKQTVNVEKIVEEPSTEISNSETIDLSTDEVFAKPTPAKKASTRKQSTANKQKTSQKNETTKPVQRNIRKSKPKLQGAATDVKDSSAKKGRSSTIIEKPTKEPTKNMVERKSKKTTTSSKTERRPAEKATKKNQSTTAKKVAKTQIDEANKAVRQHGKK